MKEIVLIIQIRSILRVPLEIQTIIVTMINLLRKIARVLMTYLLVMRYLKNLNLRTRLKITPVEAKI